MTELTHNLKKRSNGKASHESPVSAETKLFPNRKLS